MALGNTIMLLQDVSYVAAEDLEEFRGKLIMIRAQVFCLVSPLLLFYFFLTFGDFVVSVCFASFLASCGHFCPS